jgi:zinc protease
MDWLNNTERHRFANGLTLLTHVLPNSEAAALHFTVQAGYFCETDAEVGLAHLLEHMYFKGSERFPEPESMGVRMKSLGGMINASTSYDQTCYFCEVPAENLDPAIDLLGDAFLAPLFPADELTRECEVVIEEFNRKLDSPAAYSQEQLIQMAFTKHRMKRWRIGTPEQLRSYTRDHLFDYFHRYYLPQNMVVSIAGKFDEDRIAAKIERLFAPMKTQDLRKDFGPSEPPQTGLRYAFLKGAAMQSYLHTAFHAPGVTAEEEPVLEFLTFLLSSGRSARLHRYVVEQRRSASSVSFGYMAYEDVGLLFATAVTEAEKIRDAGRDFWTTVRNLMENGIPVDELNKVKSKLKLQQVMQTEDSLDLAQLLGYYQAYGGYERIRRNWETMQRLDEAQILGVASKYLRPENMSVLEYVNEDSSPLDAESYGAHLGGRSTGRPSPLPALPAIEETSTGTTAGIVTPIVHRGNVTYILLPDPHHPFVAAGIYFTGGRSEEDAVRAGLTQLLFRTALKGTSELTAGEIAFRFDSFGNPPRSNCYRDFSGFSFEALPELFFPMWDLLIHCLKDCRFPDSELQTEKGKMLAAIKRNADDNFVRPMQLFLQAFYGSHPYALPEVGFEESIAGFAAADLNSWKQRLFDTGRIIVALVGSFDPETVVPHLERSFAGMISAAEVPPALSGVSAPAAGETGESRPKKQTAFVLGFPAPAATSPDIHKYEVLQQVLSGMGGRLFQNLRAKQSLAYTVYAGLASSLYAGTFITYIAGEASKEKPALEGMWQELERLKHEPVSGPELENAKNALIGGYALGTQTASARLYDFVYSYLLTRPLPFAPVYRERIRAVTAEDLVEIARRTFHEKYSTIGIVRGTAAMTGAEKQVLS